MQNYCKIIGALAAASALVAGNAQAEVEYELHTGYSTEYIFRGVELGENLVEAGFDAAYEVNGFTLSGGFWATGFDESDSTVPSGTGNQVDHEIDFYGEVSKDLGFATVGVGYIYYWNLGQRGVDDQEIYFTASRDLGFAEASLTYYWDVVENFGGNQGYTELALSRSFELSQCVSLNVGSNVGYLIEGGDFTAWTTKVSVDWGFAENAKLSPFIAGSIALGESTESIWGTTNNELTGGAMLSVGF
ncbi:MAG: hypothetical protein HC845_11490 [Akkermansiaceae bacterium]|nr:hypothetical protein [Akkermansiaceae bacterium]NJR42244.1 hypothetical protein [Akkermansiaceae bacterium]